MFDERQGMMGHEEAVLEWHESGGKANLKKHKRHQIIVHQGRVESRADFEEQQELTVKNTEYEKRGGDFSKFQWWKVKENWGFCNKACLNE